MLKRATTTVDTSSEWLIPHVAPAPKVTAQKLRRAAQLSKRIERLRQELARVLGGTGR